MKQIKITDVTLREGDQAPLTSFNAREKALIALMLSEMWVDVIEAWFWVSRADFKNIKKVSEIVWNRNTVVSSLWRALEWDTIASLEALENVKNPRIHIFLAMSKEHIEWKFKKEWETLDQTRKRLITQAKTEIERAKSWAEKNWKNLEIEFSPEDATGNALSPLSPALSPKGRKGEVRKVFSLENNPDFDFLVEVLVEAVKSGATVLNIPDTLWNLLPHETYEFFKVITEKLNFLKEEWYNFDLSCHIHNDLALATANAVEAVRWWATYIESTLLWIWERAWNTQTNDIVGIIKEKWDALWVKLNNNFKYELIWPISSFVKEILAFDKFLQTPFIWALSDVDGSWVHNAAKDLYWGSKNKRQFRWEVVEEFFSPRWWANQIVSMLEKFGIKENKKSEFIAKTTKIAAEKSEILKALYWVNVLAIYLQEAWIFEITKIDYKNKKLDLEIKFNWEEIKFSWETEGKDGIVKTFSKLLNKYFEKEIKIKNLQVRSKPSLRQAYEKFYNKSKDILSEDFTKKAEEILKDEEGFSYGEAIWVNQVVLEIDWKEIHSNSYDKNVTIWNIKAILEWVLGEFYKKIWSKIS